MKKVSSTEGGKEQVAQETVAPPFQSPQKGAKKPSTKIITFGKVLENQQLNDAIRSGLDRSLFWLLLKENPAVILKIKLLLKGLSAVLSNTSKRAVVSAILLQNHKRMSTNVCQLTSPLLLIYIAVTPCMLHFELLFCSRPRALAARVYFVKLLPT